MAYQKVEENSTNRLGIDLKIRRIVGLKNRSTSNSI
jgi:hypothetical protein